MNDGFKSVGDLYICLVDRSIIEQAIARSADAKGVSLLISEILKIRFNILVQ